ncbi:MAG: YdjY domain-containing protein [Roseibacillus sp.]
MSAATKIASDRVCPGMARWRAVSIAVALTMGSSLSLAEKPAPVERPAPGEAAASPAPDALRKELRLPGLVINLEERCVDVESSVCLHEGTLELVACTKDSKEHESIVAVEAKPIHIHTALLLLGAESGNPAMRKPVEGAENGWIDLPPRGGRVDVFLVFKDKKGTMVEYPVSDFITASGRELEENPGADEEGAAEDARFPTHTFLFAGSHLLGEGPGPRHYLSDQSGNVISIVTFGDELLCLPEVHGHENGLLMWQVNGTGLPKIGSKVTLRLRPQLPPAPNAGKPDQPPSAPSSGKAQP